MSRDIAQHLIEKSSKGDAEAFSEIYFSLKDPLYGFAFRMTNTVSIAEEITQEVFLFFIENSEKYDAERGSLFSFLCGVARNKVLNYLKKSGTRLETNDLEEDLFESPSNTWGRSPIRNLLDKEFSGKLEQCVQSLPPYQKEVLLLREIEELSYEEIAAITETNIGTIKQRLYRARQALAAGLEPYLKTEEVKYELHRS
ncbi:MAG: RNA polymerase sigma factor [Pyrinomonadaceae bacterium]